jgi:hypothetical protein
MWSEFTAFLATEKVKYDERTLSAERDDLTRALRREIARRVSGDAAAARVALEGDPVFAKALAVLGRAKAATDVFAAAGLEAPRGGAAAR